MISDSPGQISPQRAVVPSNVGRSKVHATSGSLLSSSSDLRSWRRQVDVHRGVGVVSKPNSVRGLNKGSVSSRQPSCPCRRTDPNSSSFRDEASGLQRHDRPYDAEAAVPAKEWRAGIQTG